MELLRVIKEQEVYPESKFLGENNKIRKAVRAVIFDNENKVALINVSKHNYYKLPGGGIEGDESVESALRRECLEEVGCDVFVGEELGRIIEYRNQWETEQESSCYLAKIKGEKGEPKLVGYEIDSEFKPVWVDINEAIKLVEDAKPDTYDGPFIKIRDSVFLKKAKEMLK